KEAGKECFETILALWKHRWLLPSRKRPLEEFEPILKTLERLNPEEQEPYFYHSLDHELSELEKNNPDLKEITDCTNMALQIDKAARVWIEFVLSQAALKAKNEKTDSFLNNSINIHDNDDARIIRIVLDSDPAIGLENYKDDNVQKKYQSEKLKRRIEELERFSKLNEVLLEKYRKDKTLQLLRAEHFPLLVAFFHLAFKQQDKISYLQSELQSLLGDYMYALQRQGINDYTKSAIDYLQKWAEQGYLRRYYERVDEPVYELSPATENALKWLEDLNKQQFIGTHSRLIQFFHLLQQIVNTTS